MCPYEIEIDEAELWELPASEQDQPTDITRLEALTDAQLDELSFGVICLARDGTILRYNLAEARLARLDRAVVLGKKFFSQVAPCTARPEFQGRFEAFVDDATRGPSDRFSYLFDFSFGAQLVTIELVRPRQPGQAYLLVNRNQMMAVRSDAFRPAPALADWEGDAPAGVLRDSRGQRFVQLPGAALGKLLQAALRLGVDPDRLLEEWGVDWGRRSGIELEAWALEDHGLPLRQLPIGQAMALVAQGFARQGWGTLSVDFTAAPQSGAFVVRIERSIWQESLRTAPARQQRFTEGYLRALLTHLAGRRLVVAVVGAGDEPAEHTEFLVVGEGRGEALRQAIQQGGVSVADILQSLGRVVP